jgi:hypothetical protein
MKKLMQRFPKQVMGAGLMGIILSTGMTTQALAHTGHPHGGAAPEAQPPNPKPISSEANQTSTQPSAPWAQAALQTVHTVHLTPLLSGSSQPAVAASINQRHPELGLLAVMLIIAGPFLLHLLRYKLLT